MSDGVAGLPLIINFVNRDFKRTYMEELNRDEGVIQFIKLRDTVHFELNPLRFDDMSTFLKGRVRMVSPRELDKRRVTFLSHKTNEELFSMVNNSSEKDWDLRPLHYEAIKEELKARSLT